MITTLKQYRKMNNENIYAYNVEIYKEIMS